MRSKFEISDRFSGDFVGRVTPVPIPNTEVKPAGADGTARVTVWESRKSPELFQEGPLDSIRAGLLVFSRTTHPKTLPALGTGSAVRRSPRPMLS